MVESVWFIANRSHKLFPNRVSQSSNSSGSPCDAKEVSTFRTTINHNPLLIIDLALPRDIDPKVREINSVELFCLEDLDTVIKKNIEKKAQETQKAIVIINREVEKLWGKFIEWEPEPVLLP